MTTVRTPLANQRLRDEYATVRALTETLAAPLSAEDQTVQSMPDVSPTKWHRGHTSWFFETFLLSPALPGYRLYHPQFAYIFNSYYEAVGARHPRPDRGLISRPGIAEVARYRAHVDRAMEVLFDAKLAPSVLDLIELGLHHEQQHQELVLMDIKHVLSVNPLRPGYHVRAPRGVAEAAPLGWIEHTGGLTELGHQGDSFGFDNEFPRHVTWLTPFALADRAVTCGEWLEFMADGGYERPELWLSDGWALVQGEHWRAPQYWSPAEDVWQLFTLSGDREIDLAEPVCHVSYYEADAYTHWTGGRLPKESEWEAIAAAQRVDGHFLDLDVLHPSPGPGNGFFGDTWEWTQSSYTPYPGFRTAPGAVGEYNGKFMVNQYVLRGGSCVTPAGHTRATYRNFFPAAARWAFSGVRLARDL